MDSCMRLIAPLALVLGLLVNPGLAKAQGEWLDEPLAQWNEPGRAVPFPEMSEFEPPPDPRCLASARPPETAMDEAVMAAGWILFNPYEAGWGVALVPGLSGHDGMCRPWAYHTFIFVDGQFAGTLAPVVSSSRTDGALISSALNDDGIRATFVRYAETDPLCCPSHQSTTVEYRIERTDRGPVVIATRKS